MTRDELSELVETVEESYEFFLGYAAQGVSGEGSDGEARRFFEKMDAALQKLPDGFQSVVEGAGKSKDYGDMVEVLRRDAGASRAAVKLVLASSQISSQLTDNFNASIHVRALLTDLFLLDEALPD